MLSAQAEKVSPKLQKSPTIREEASKGKKRKANISQASPLSRHLWKVVIELRQPQGGRELQGVTNFP